MKKHFILTLSFLCLLSATPAEAHRVHFPKESQMENFLVKNWKHTVFAENFDIYRDKKGRTGKQYPTDTGGKIDILAISKDKKTFLVIELKRGGTSDKVIGQCQRYMGFVKEKLAKKDQEVRGAIVASKTNKKIKRALSVVPNIDFYKYKINYKVIHLERIE